MPRFDWYFDAAWSLDGHSRLVLSAQLISICTIIGYEGTQCHCVIAVSPIGVEIVVSIGVSIAVPIGREGFGNVSFCTAVYPSILVGNDRCT